MTEFFFYRALPFLMIGFIVYGPFVILCDKIGLNAGPKGKERKLEERRQNVQIVVQDKDNQIKVEK